MSTIVNTSTFVYIFKKKKKLQKTFKCKKGVTSNGLDNFFFQIENWRS